MYIFHLAPSLVLVLALIIFSALVPFLIIFLMSPPLVLVLVLVTFLVLVLSLVPVLVPILVLVVRVFVFLLGAEPPGFALLLPFLFLFS